MTDFPFKKWVLLVLLLSILLKIKLAQVIDEIPICHININNVEYLKIIDGSAFENEDSFLYSELSASDGYLQTIQLLSERKSKDDTINEKDKIHFSETGGAFHPENKAIKDDLKMDTIDIIEESYEKML